MRPGLRSRRRAKTKSTYEGVSYDVLLYACPAQDDKMAGNSKTSRGFLVGKTITSGARWSGRVGAFGGSAQMEKERVDSIQ